MIFGPCRGFAAPRHRRKAHRVAREHHWSVYVTVVRCGGEAAVAGSSINDRGVVGFGAYIRA
jgi:hypothetical protein